MSFLNTFFGWRTSKHTRTTAREARKANRVACETAYQTARSVIVQNEQLYLQRAEMRAAGHELPMGNDEQCYWNAQNHGMPVTDDKLEGMLALRRQAAEKSLGRPLTDAEEIAVRKGLLS